MFVEILYGKRIKRMFLKQKGTKAIIIGIILVLVSIFMFLYWSSKKEIWFCDEIYTFESAHGMEQDWPASTTAQWMKKAEIEAFFAADGDTLSLSSITNVLYNDHVPLYFWLFRIIAFFCFKGSATIWTGYTINLVCYVMFLIIGYLFFGRITKKPVVSGGIMLFVGVVNKVMIAQATMLRMYMMLVCWELILVILGLLILREANEKKLRPVTYISLCIFSILGFLTHYDYWVFYALTAAVFCSWLLIVALRGAKKNFWKTYEFKHVCIWCINFVVSLLCTIAIFPYCRWNLNRGKGQTALHSIFVFSQKKLDNIEWGLQRLSASVFGESLSPAVGIILILACVCGAIFLLYKKKDRKKAVGLILVMLTSLGYQFVICFTMPDLNEERYLWGGFTIIHMCFIWSGYLLLNAIPFKWKNKSIRRGLLLICSLLWVMVQAKVIDNGNGIPYLFHPDKDVTALEAHSDVPWIVYGPTVGVYSYYDWLIPEEICFLSLENTVEDAEAVSVLQEKDSFVLYIYEEYLPQAMTFFEEELGKELSSTFMTKSTNLTVYLIEE